MASLVPPLVNGYLVGIVWLAWHGRPAVQSHSGATPRSITTRKGPFSGGIGILTYQHDEQSGGSCKETGSGDGSAKGQGQLRGNIPLHTPLPALIILLGFFIQP